MLGYSKFLELLKDSISPQEADAGERQTRISTWVLIGSVVALVLISPLFGLDYMSETVGIWGNLGPLLLSLALVTGLRIPYAGRVLMTVDSIIPSTDYVWWLFQPYSDLGVLIFRVSVGFTVGALIDFGASAVPGASRSRVRRWTLVGLGLAWSPYEI